MKILKPGVVKPKFWWLGVKFSCKSCGCEFELDESDWKTDDSVFTIPCPTCAQSLRFSKPMPSIDKTNDLWAAYAELFKEKDNVFEQLFGPLLTSKPEVKKEAPPKKESTGDVTTNAIYKWIKDEADKGRWKPLDDFFAYQTRHVKDYPLEVLVAYATASLPYAGLLPSRKAFIEQCTIQNPNPSLWKSLV